MKFIPKARASARSISAVGAALLLCACSQDPVTRAPTSLDAPSGATAAQPVSQANHPALSPFAETPVVEMRSNGTCLAREDIPAIYEQVMGEVQVVQAEIAPDGTLMRAPVYRKAMVPRIVQPRGEFTFEAVCGHQMTTELISSLQRALAARNYFGGNVTGWIDAPTSAAIRLYQADRGLDSSQLSLETARALGLVAVDLSGS